MSQHPALPSAMPSSAIVRRQLVSRDQIPAWLAFNEDCPGYVPAIDKMHRDYRGKDRRMIQPSSLFNQPIEDRKAFDLRRPAVVQITCADGFTAVFGDLRLGQDSVVKVSHSLDTQYPSISLEIASDTKNGNPVTAIIYADAIEEGMDNAGMPAGIRSAAGQDISVDEWDKFEPVLDLRIGVKELKEGLLTETEDGDVYTDIGKVWLTSISIDSRRASDSPDETDLDQPSAETMQTDSVVSRKSKVRFSGVTAGRVRSCQEDMLTKDYNPNAVIDNSDDTPQQDQVIGLLSCADFELHIFTKASTGNIRLLCNDFIPYFLGLIKTSMTFGHFWFYNKQMEGSRLSLRHHITLKGGLHVPRWLVTEIEATFAQDKSSHIELTKWSSYRLPSVLCQGDCAFLTTLAIQRGRTYQHSFLGYLFGGGAACRATFTRNPNKDTQYLVEVFLLNLKTSGEFDVRLPAIDTRITIKIDSGKEKDNPRFMGVITDDHFNNSNVHLTAFVEGDISPKTGEKLMGWLSVIDDITPAAREINVVRLASDWTKNHGVDIPALLHLREPSTLNTDWLKKEFELRPESKKAYTKVIDDHVPELNKRQREAAMKVLQSADGVELISGASCTGKTTLSQLIVEGMAQAGMTVLVVSHNNKAVDVAYNTFKKLTKLESHQFIRFRGESTHDQQVIPFNRWLRYESYADQQNQEKDQAMADDLWDMISSCSSLNLGEDGYHMKLHAWAIGVADDTEHPSMAIATEYLDLVKRLQSNGMDGKAETDLQDEIRKLRTTKIAKAYLGCTVKVVFATTTSSCHGQLWRLYRPSIVVCEDAALSPIPDLAMPLASFIGSIKLVVLSGDYKRQRPLMMSASANEAGKVLKSSLLEILIKDEKREHTTLDISYRAQSNQKPNGAANRGGSGGRVQRPVGSNAFVAGAFGRQVEFVPGAWGPGSSRRWPTFE